MNSSLRSLKYQSNSITSINKCILNNSPSKRLNSFAKANRFPKEHFPPHFFNRAKTQAHYEILKKPIVFPTIPRADRVFYFPQEKELKNNPSPLDYKVKYQDQINKVTHKGNTIGVKLSRSSSKQSLNGSFYYQGENILKKSYNKTSTFHRSSRNLSEFLNAQGRDSPGPKYEINESLSRRNTARQNAVREKKVRNTGKTKNLIQQKVNRFQTKMLQSQLVAKKEVKKVESINVRPKKIVKNKQIANSFRKTAFSAPSLSPGPADYVFFSQFSGWR